MMRLEISYWVERLEDPFETFPMQSVMRSLADLADEQRERQFDRASLWGTPRPTVEDEHDFQVVEHIVGSAFVLGQATITQAVSLVKRMRADARNPSWIPSDKREIMKTAAPIHPETGLSNLEQALRELGIYPTDMAPLAQLVVTWRDELAEHIRVKGKSNGVSIAPRL